MASRMGPHATAAGAAVLMLGSDETPVASVQALVPRGVPQTSQAGEFLAGYLANCLALEVRLVARLAAQMGQSPSESFNPKLCADCTGVVSMFEHAEDFAANHRMMYAGVARDILRDGSAISSAKHVSAHLALDNAVQSRRVTVCNAHADTACKAMAASNLPSKAELELYQANHDEVKQFCIGAATMLAKWPSSYDLFGKLTRVEGGQDPKKCGRKTSS